MDGDEAPKRGLRLRHDGFTPARQRIFLDTLGKTGCVRDACRRAGISNTSAYRARDRLGPEFARQWDLAQAMAASSLEALAWERAVTGIEEPVYFYGKFSHMRVRRSDSLFRLLLQASNPKKYGRLGPVRRKTLRKWERKAIEAEIQANQPPLRTSIEEARESLFKKLRALGVRPDPDYDKVVPREAADAPALAPPDDEEE